MFMIVGQSWLQLNGKKSIESQTRLMSWNWKQESTWRKDLITYNSHHWIMFYFNWLVIIWRERESGGGRWGCLKLCVQGQGDGRILDIAGQGRWGIWKIGQFSWTSHVYRPWETCVTTANWTPDIFRTFGYSDPECASCSLMYKQFFRATILILLPHLVLFIKSMTYSLVSELQGS